MRYNKACTQRTKTTRSSHTGNHTERPHRITAQCQRVGTQYEKMQVQKIIYTNRLREWARRESEQILTAQQQESGRQHTCIKAKHQSEYDLTFLKPLRSGIVRGTRSLHQLADHIIVDLFNVCCKCFCERLSKRKTSSTID